jgi:hypothetical protein
MTDEGLRLLQRSWRALDPVEVAARWQAHLAALDPELAARADAVPPAALVAVLEALLNAVDDPERLVELAAEWGKHPAALELGSRSHLMLGDALRESLRELLGPAWTPALHSAWLEAAILVSSVMRRSALRASGEWPRPVAPVAGGASAADAAYGPAPPLARPAGNGDHRGP